MTGGSGKGGNGGKSASRSGGKSVTMTGGGGSGKGENGGKSGKVSVSELLLGSFVLIFSIRPTQPISQILRRQCCLGES